MSAENPENTEQQNEQKNAQSSEQSISENEKTNSPIDPSKEGSKRLLPDDLEAKRRALYEKGYQPEAIQSRVKTGGYDTPTNGWQGEHQPQDNANARLLQGIKKTTGTYVRFFAIIAGLFVLLAGALVIFFFLYAGQATPEKVFIQIEPPQNVYAGETTNIAVRIENTNRVPLTNVKLVLRAGEGAGASPIGTVTAEMVPAKGDYVAEISTTIIGRKNEKKLYSLMADFTLGNTSTVYQKETVKTVNISTAPVSVNIVSPRSALPNEEVVVRARLQSNTSVDLENVGIRFISGDSFVVSDSQPQFASQRAWQTDLAAGAEKEFSLVGSFGDNARADEEFLFVVENLPSDGAGADAVVLARTARNISVTFPPVTLSLNTQPFLTPSQFAKELRLTQQIQAYNRSQTDLTNLGLTFNISGSLARYAKLVSENYNFLTNNYSLVWTRETLAELTSIGVGDSVSTTAGLVLSTSVDQVKKLTNAELTMELFATAGKVEDFRQGETIASIKRTIKVLSEPTVIPSLLEIPEPTAGQQTPAIMDINLDGYRNDLSNVVVSFELPIYTDYIDAEVSHGRISYEPLIKSLVWEIEQLPSDTFPTASVRLSINPGPDQRGKNVLLTKNLRFVGYDTFVGERIETSVSGLEVKVRG